MWWGQPSTSLGPSSLPSRTSISSSVRGRPNKLPKTPVTQSLDLSATVQQTVPENQLWVSFYPYAIRPLNSHWVLNSQLRVSELSALTILHCPYANSKGSHTPWLFPHFVVLQYSFKIDFFFVTSLAITQYQIMSKLNDVFRHFY